MGLAARATLGFKGGIGGTVMGLAARVTLGCKGGIGGTVIGLATAILATATMAAAKIKLRNLSELAVMNLHSLNSRGNNAGKE